ncbi:transglycosylase SLT domain-containing protein [Campylobacter sp. B0100352/1]|uniref:transglycosylase SLT domain-containing protein n=1 Tax=Campylobacter sp. B0100352/1 TaxID=2735783 RepID=UPI001DA40F04|nr:transglycosylase SLT domain-containing protein [Campylobacter sp. B0100352/1]
MIDIDLIEQCKNPNVETQIIQKIIQIESKNENLAININKVGSFVPKTKDEAKTLAQSFINKGYSVDIGLMQFNSNNLKTPTFKNYSIDDLLDPCKNIKAGSDIFYLAYEMTNENLTKEERINQALSIYNTGDLKKGFSNGYVAKYDSTTKIVDNLEEKARKSNTKIKIAYNLFNLQTQQKE